VVCHSKSKGKTIGLAIKNAVRDSPKAGLVRIKGLVIKSLPNEPCNPSKTTIGKYLKECGKVKKKDRLKKITLSHSFENFTIVKSFFLVDASF
jgi:hypothetical protein